MMRLRDLMLNQGGYMLSDRDLINNWLTTRTFDEEDRAEVMKACEQDPEARKYWTERAKQSWDKGELI